jgi:HSP20 family protein
LRTSGGDFWRAPESAFGAVPAVDVTETDGGFEVTAELPGMGEKNTYQPHLDDQRRKAGREKGNEKDYYMRERSFGSFQRSFTVPEGVDTDKIEASFKKGVLTVTVPKTAEAKKAEKRITVKVA